MKVVLWESHLEPHQRDRALPDKLQQEHPGILAWLVRGLLDWMDHGFIEPADVAEASADYKDDSDPIASFLRICTAHVPAERVQASHPNTRFRPGATHTGTGQGMQKSIYHP